MNIISNKLFHKKSFFYTNDRINAICLTRYTACPKKPAIYGFLRKTGLYFPKLFLNSKTSCISTSFKKNSILSHMAKKLQVLLAAWDV